MNWIFKKNDNLQIDSSNKKATVTFTQKSNFTGKDNENVLILEKRKTEWEFTALYRIASVVVKDPEAEYKETTVNMDLVKQFDDEKLLEDYIYSLRRVTNYSKPIKHFSRKYSRLFDVEFDAILNDVIYQKRTILGSVLNSMHSDHQKAFIGYLAVQAPEQLTGSIDMDLALELLIQYLEFAVIKPAEYLIESSNILQSIISNDEYISVGFALDIQRLNQRNIQLIAPQVVLINGHLSDLFGYDNGKFSIQPLQIQDNPKFRQLFRNTPLPVTLN